jgi:long-chain acyl-CoA synthetase
VKRVKKLVPPYSLPPAVSFQEVLTKGKSASFSPVEKKAYETALLQYTGGTTGISKGAELSHTNMTTNLQQTESYVRAVFPAEATAIVPLPLYHAIALHASLLFMKVGYKNLLITNPKDIPGYIRVLKSQPFHIMIGVNTLFNALANHPKIFSSLKVSIGGGMAIQEAVSEKWKDLVGHHITQGYGLSETSPMLTINIPGKDRPGYIGIPFPSTEIRIVDEAGNDVEPGEPGELCARGPQVFKGYWNKDNQDVFYPGGWSKTGDIAVMEADGFFKIVDRKKDMIIVSGFNVYPNEVEAVVATHPKVLEVAAIGVTDNHSTEVVKLFVVKRDPSLTEQELSKFCQTNLVNYKRPRHIEFRDELPKSNVGKILRRALRDSAYTYS